MEQTPQNLEEITGEISEELIEENIGPSRTGKLFKSIRKKAGNVMNPKIGIPVGLCMAGIAAYSHKKYGLGTMAAVGAKHFVTSSIMGSVAGRLCQYGARVKNPLVAYTLGELYPMVFANTVMLSVHFSTGTPEPLKAITGPALAALTIINPLTIHLTRRGILK